MSQLTPLDQQTVHSVMEDEVKTTNEVHDEAMFMSPLTDDDTAKTALTAEITKATQEAAAEAANEAAVKAVKAEAVNEAADQADGNALRGN